MSHDEQMLAVKVVAFIAGFILVSGFLWVVWAREQVKKALHRQGFAPISIRWCPFAYWAWFEDTGFTAKFVDATGCIETARCGVWFSRVRWIADDVKYLDKNLSIAGRLTYLAISLLLAGFALKHLFTGELVLPPSIRQTQPRPVYLHGGTLNLMLIAALCYAASFITEIVYCYHVRANERHYTFVVPRYS
jgi:hypothetical protein